MYNLLVHDRKRGGLGYETKFSFKWIPCLQNITTPLGDPMPGRDEQLGAFKHRGVERTALLALVSTGTIFSLTLWAGYRATAALGRIVLGNMSWERVAAPLWSLA